jgi:predicted phosphodiesterase
MTDKLLGIISDTHGFIRPQALEALKGIDMILHAVDIGSHDVLDIPQAKIIELAV